MRRFLVVVLMIIMLVPAVVCAYPYEGQMIAPVEEIDITSEYGWREHPIYETPKFHAGVDLGTDYGDIVYASYDGVIELSGWVQGYGNCIYIDHGQGVETVYGHNEQLLVQEGQLVKKNQPIALSGSTGNSTGPHVHFEVDVEGEPQDPALFVNGLPKAHKGPIDGA